MDISSASIPSPASSPARTLVAGSGFSGWHALNDTVMGGRSSGSTSVGPEGLRFAGEVVEEGAMDILLLPPLFRLPIPNLFSIMHIVYLPKI
jgi:hypothetical protein